MSSLNEKNETFDKYFGDVRIRAVSIPGKGTCLEATYHDQMIIMDISDTEERPIPDGSNAYMFGNKLIMVTRWRDLSESEKQTLKSGDVMLIIHPYRVMQFSLYINDGWEDVFFTLPHCFADQNNETEPVREMIYIVCDSHHDNFIESRQIELPEQAQNFLRKGNSASHKELALDDVNELTVMKAILANCDRANMSELDYYAMWEYCDAIYDICYEKTLEYSRAAKEDPSDRPKGIYVAIDGMNRVKGIRQF